MSLITNLYLLYNILKSILGLKQGLSLYNLPMAVSRALLLALLLVSWATGLLLASSKASSDVSLQSKIICSFVNLNKAKFKQI